MPSEPATYPGYRFPAEVIRRAVWLYHVFSLSLRDVELILAERGLTVSHESIRRWVLRFGTDFAARLRKRRPRPGDTWHLDEVFLRINGELLCLWRAVDQHGMVLDLLVQGRRNAGAAKRFFRRLLVGLRCEPKRLVTDRLRSYGVAHRESLPDVRHRVCRYLNNRAENSHRPTRAPDAALQVAGAGAAVPPGPRDDPRPLAAASTSDDRWPAPSRPSQSLPDLARGDVRPDRGVNVRTVLQAVEHAMRVTNVTMPARGLRA